MAYPNASEIATAAATLGVDPLQVYAYAAVHGAVPKDPSDLNALAVQVATLAPWGIGNVPDATKWGYIQSHGSVPTNAQYFVDWGTQQGYLVRTANTWIATQNVPFAGDGYPPGGEPTNPTAPATTTPTTPPTSGFNLGSLFKNPLVLGGVALAGAYALGIFPHRR